MNMHTTITAKLPAYTRQQAIAMEQRLLEAMPGAGKSRHHRRDVPIDESRQQKLARQSQANILDYLAEHGTASAGVIGPAVGLHRGRASYWLNVLRNEGLTRMTGAGNAKKWELVK